MQEIRTEAPRPDPLIDEIRAIRKAISDAHGNDVHRLGRYLQEMQKRWGDRIVRKSPAAPSRP